MLRELSMKGRCERQQQRASALITPRRAGAQVHGAGQSQGGSSHRTGDAAQEKLAKLRDAKRGQLNSEYTSAGQRA
jgi:hypothetical protein